MLGNQVTLGFVGVARQDERIDANVLVRLELGHNLLGVADDRRSSAATSCLLYTSPSPRDATLSRMPSSA